MKRFLGLLLIPLLAVSFVGLFGSSSASAASDYDDYIQVTQQLSLDRIECGKTDISTIWGGINETNVVSNHQQYAQDFLQLYQDRQRWIVAQTDVNQVNVYFQTSNEFDNEVIWDIDYVATSYNNYTYTLYLDDDCNVVWRPLATNNMIAKDRAVFHWYGEPYQLIFLMYGYDLNFPPDYEGEIPPETTGPPLIVRDIIAPDFEYDYNDYTITATDHVNDLIPEFVPDEGYTSNGPHVQWTLWKCSIEYEKGVCKGDREIINLTDKPLNEGMTWTVEEYGFYKIEAEYSLTQCYRYASYPDTPDHCFNASLMALFGDNYVFEMRSKEFHIDGTSGSGDTINEDCDIMGSCSSPGSITGGMLPCFTSDFPYIDVPGCVTNVFWIVDSLTFSQITIMDIQSNTLECKQLNTVGAWIHQPGITVCPLFPEHVRDVVTPFITFAFVLMLAGFIMRLGSDRS